MRLQKNRNKAPAGSLAAGTAALAALVLLPLYMMNGYVELIKGKFCLLLVLAFTACLAAPFGGKGFRLQKKEAASWLPLPVLCAAYAAALAIVFVLVMALITLFFLNLRKKEEDNVW